MRGQAGREVQRVGRTCGAAISEAQSPQVPDGDRPPVCVFQLAGEMAVRRIEGVDGAIAEIADQQVVAEATEVRRSHRYGPRLIEHAVADQALLQLAVRVV